MKFTSKGDIDAPLEHVYARMSDFDGWEKAIRKRNATLSRSAGDVAPGTRWDTKFNYRGKPREITVVLNGIEPQRRLDFTATGASLDAAVTLDLIQLSPKRTRLAVVIEMKPRNLAARLFIQSLRLARGKVQSRIDQRVQQFATETGERYAAQKR